MIPLRFTAADADRAYEEWRCSCGPAALAAILGLTLDEIRPHLGDFERKGYMSPTMMWAALDSTDAKWRADNNRRGALAWPRHGLARIQWEGPWVKEGVPAAAAYTHTHWVAAAGNPVTGIMVFDINSVQPGWLQLDEWARIVLPLLLAQHPKRTGWHLTHTVEIERGAA